MKKIFVINSRGKREEFSFQKVFDSAKRAGAQEKLAGWVANEIARKARNGIKTYDIFREVKRLLKKDSPDVALRFSLKDAMRKLGPTGFTFEKYIGRVFEALGYEVKLNQIVKGKCISYEIDFLAKKGDVFLLGECKYRNMLKDRVHTKDILITYARFLDIQEVFPAKLKPILVTNTKFTQRTASFAKCRGIGLLGWREPFNNGLEQIIDQYKLFPITILPSLNKHLAEVLSAQNKVLAKDVLSQTDKRFEKLKQEAQTLFL